MVVGRERLVKTLEGNEREAFIEPAIRRVWIEDRRIVRIKAESALVGKKSLVMAL